MRQQAHLYHHVRILNPGFLKYNAKLVQHCRYH